MGNWKPDIHSEVGHRQVFMWIVPAKAAGRWTGSIGAESFGLDLQQEYQYLKGSATDRRQDHRRCARAGCTEPRCT